MGDQFPSDVRYFIELSQKASDLNALLQGLVGRSCGYGKDSLVILSDQNDRILDAYVATHGDYVMTPKGALASAICTVTNVGTALGLSSCFQRNSTRAARVAGGTKVRRDRAPWRS
jgi:hypothetical protein